MMETFVEKLAAILVIFSFFLTGCASIHGSGNYAIPVNGKLTSDSFSADVKKTEGKDLQTKKGLMVSGSENVSLSSDYFTLVDFTFENKSADWLRITRVDIDFGNDKANTGIRFPVGQDLMDWAQSAKQVQAIRDYNMQMALGAVAGAGVALSGSGSRSTQKAGVAMAAGSSAILTAQSVGNNLDALQRARVIPEDHLLSGVFSVPPGLFKKKWITLYTKHPDDIPFVKKMALKMTYEDGSTETVLLKLRDLGKSSSDWQKKHPEVEAAREAKRRIMK